MADMLNIKLVAPAVWQPVLADALAGVSADEQPFVRSGLSALLRRHVGITPNLMAALAPAVLRPHHRSDVGGAWGHVYTRLLDSLRADANQKNEETPRVASLTLSADPTYMLLEVAAPIVQAACRRLGCVCLLCADAEGTAVNQKEYASYDRQLTGAIAELAQDKTENASLFWRERALTLSSLTRQRDDSSSLLPELDPLAVGMFLRLQPERKPGQDHGRRNRPLSHLQRQRNLRWREEGFDGIHLSHSDEDLPYRLITEYLYDQPVQVDRILNTGFLALEREPRRIRLRDVLITAYLPSAFWGTVQADFLRASWFDFTMRAALLLRQNMLLKSEFRWIEADGLGRGRTVVFRLEEMPEGSKALERTRREIFRTQFCTGLRWLPRIMDAASAGFRAVQTARTSTDDWIKTFWRLQEEELPADAENFNGVQEPLRAEDFVYTFHMPFLPAGSDPPTAVEAQERHARLSAGLHAVRPYQGTACLTWAPLNPANSRAWYITGRSRHHEGFGQDDGDAEKPEANQLAGKIVDAWLDQFLKETHGA